MSRDLCGLAEVEHRMIGALSKGFRQRVGLADAMIHEPELLILDEPTIGLDPNQIRQVRELIKNLRRHHTILLSTHILPEVEMTCSRVIIINKGRIEALDTPENLRSRISSEGEVLLEAKTEDPHAIAKLRSVNGVKDVVQKKIGDWTRFHSACRKRPQGEPACTRGKGGLAGAGIDETLRHPGTGLCRGDPLRRTVMKRFLTLLAREVSHYFHQPLAYIVLFFFLLLTAANFHAGLVALNREPGQTSVVEAFFNTVLFWFPFVLIFPLLTMRLFSEEYKLGTIETLMTAPVRDGQVVVAKFLGSFVFYLVLWAPSLLYFVALSLVDRSERRGCLRILSRSLFDAYSRGDVLSFHRLPRLCADQESDRGRNHCFRFDQPHVFSQSAFLRFPQGELHVARAYVLFFNY